jgi:peptidoglycan/LPS O-acetylase OafA/YrhL
MHEQTIKLIGGIYAIIGLMALPGFFYMFAYGPKLSESSMGILFVLGFPLLWCGVSWLLAYSFFTKRRWGRYLAILVNGLALGAVVLSFVVARMTEVPPPEFTPPALFFLLGFLVISGSLLVFCFRSPTKRLMCN